MTKDEIINVLLNKSIINEIDGTYFLTEKYKEVQNSSVNLTAVSSSPVKITNYDELLDASTNGNNWPVEILESVGRTRAVAFMDACKIPTISKKGYMLRGVDKQALNVLGNIVENRSIHPNTLIDAVKHYYTYVECPKGIKNFLVDGDILDVYNLHIEGKLISTLKNTNIENEGTWQ